MQGNESGINGVPTSSPGSAAIHLHPGIAIKVLSGLGKKGTLQRLWKPECHYNHLAQSHNERQFVLLSFSTYQISSGQPYFIRSSSVGIKISMSKAQDLINNKSNYPSSRNLPLLVSHRMVSEQKEKRALTLHLPAPPTAGTPPSNNFEIFRSKCFFKYPSNGLSGQVFETATLTLFPWRKTPGFTSTTEL